MRTQDTYWIQNPFPKLPERSDPGADAAQQCVSLVQFLFILFCLARLDSQVYVPQEFFSNQSRPSIMLVRLTLVQRMLHHVSLTCKPHLRNERSKYAMATMATWLLRFPFVSSYPGSLAHQLSDATSEAFAMCWSLIALAMCHQCHF